jgi:hypothetical protein
MDQELLQGNNKLSRNLDSVDEILTEDDHDGNRNITNEGGHVLVNLLKSLEAQAGMPGPVDNMMKEMGGATFPK